MDNSVSNNIFKGTVIIVLIGIIAKFASFLSEAILASYLGTTYESDAYYMVSSIQQVIYPMLSVGTWKVFLPIYKEKVTTGKLEQANKLTDQVITVFTLVSFAIVVLLVIFAGVVVSIVAPGFEGTTRLLCIKLVRISAPMYIFITAAAVYASILQCHNKFTGSQIREVASHIPTIIVAILLYKALGVEALAVALVLGGVLRLLVELPFVDWGYKYKPNLDYKNKSFKLIVKRLPSALISEGIVQINTLVDKAMASTLPEGTISGLNYGVKLMNVLSGLLSTAIATALYPQMIALIALEKKNELGNLIAKIINIFSVLMVPVTMGSILFRKEIVSAVFERGAFDHKSVLLTSGVFALYCVGIFFIACNTVLTNLFYGFGDTKTPMYVSIINLFINIGLNLCLIKIWGVFGLALATSLSAVIVFFIRMLLAKKLVYLNYMNLIVTFIKIFIVSAVSCMIPRLLFNYLSINKFAVLLLSVLIAVPIYFAILKFINIRELDDITSIAIKNISKRKSSQS